MGLATRAVLACVLAMLMPTSVAWAQFAPHEVHELSPPVGNLSGVSVALSGELAFVGSPSGQSVGPQRHVHAYRHVGDAWNLEQTFDNPVPGTRFGWSLDFDGTTLLVGAPNLPKTIEGRVHAYTFAGASWNLATLPYPPGETAALSYGTSVAVDGDHALVGAPINGGSVFAYRRSPEGTWIFAQKLGPKGNAFGVAVDLHDGYALIGTGQNDRVHAYRLDGTVWTDIGNFAPLPGTSTPDSGFGQALSISGSRAVIGAWQDELGAQQGAAFVFERVCDTWVQRERLDAPMGAASYGRGVAIDDDAVLVGAPGEDVGGTTSAGAAYAYRWTGSHWILEQHLQSSAPASFDQLGRDVVVADDRALLGAQTAMPGISGSALIFEATAVPRPWIDLGHGLAGGTRPELRGTGVVQPAAAVTLDLSCGSPGGAAILVIGLTAIDAPFKGGVLVPSPLFVLGLTLGSGGASSLPTVWPSDAPVGASLVMQAWFPDGAGVSGFSASNALLATTTP